MYTPHILQPCCDIFEGVYGIHTNSVRVWDGSGNSSARSTEYSWPVQVYVEEQLHPRLQPSSTMREYPWDGARGEVWVSSGGSVMVDEVWPGDFKMRTTMFWMN